LAAQDHTTHDNIPGFAARRAAFALVQGVLARKETLADQLSAAHGPLQGLEPSQRARAQSLATGTLRHLTRLDAALAPFLERPPPPAVQSVLRLATHEMLVDGVPPHAAVDGAVHLARAGRKTGRFTKLVNAVARRVSQTDAKAFAEMPPAALPSWLAKPVIRSFGEEAAQAMAQAHGQTPPVDLCVRDGTPETWAERLGADLLPTGALRLSPRSALSSLDGYADGAWWVQDAAAQCPVALLGDVRGARVLDLCAAPGGKTLQLAALGAQVTALDLSGARLERVRENLDRTGLQAQLVEADARTWTPDAPFDAVLLDAPCSATGTLRRHPDLPFVRPAPDLTNLLALQADLIDRAFDCLRPGGTLVYATCSLLPREGERQVADALARLPGLARAPWALPQGWEAGWKTAEGDLRLRPDYWPDLGGMDGFFAARLMRMRKDG